MTPVLKKLYSTDEELSAALKRHLVFFNTEGTFGAIIQGIVISMEEQKANGENVTDEAITGIKTGLMGPIAGMGDAIVWAAIMPIIISIFLPFASNGSALGGVMPLILYPAVTIAIAYGLIHNGYTLGKRSVVSLLHGGKMKSIIFTVNVIGLTMMGASTISKGVGETLVEAAGNYVVIDNLYAWAGKRIGEMIGTEDACVTSSASAGIALAVASLICGNSLQKVQHLYDILPDTPKREVILLKGQNVDFGAPIALMAQAGGAKIVEVGYANGSKPGDIEAAVNEHTLAVLFVKSHHCVQKEMVDARTVIELTRRLGVPCIVDAAAEEDLKAYAAMGADFVCYSGAKAIEGPTSGFVACRTAELADNMRLQYKGIGRTMKVGKECTMGLVKAIEEYLAGGKPQAVALEDLERFAAKTGEIEGLKTSIIQDEAGRKIYRCKIDFDPARYGLNAKEAVKALQEGDVAVYTRDYQANIGSVAIDPRPLNSLEELDTIYRRLLEIHQSAAEGKQSRGEKTNGRA